MEGVLQDRIYCRNDGLDRVIEKVGEADRKQDSEDGILCDSSITGQFCRFVLRLH